MEAQAETLPPTAERTLEIEDEKKQPNDEADSRDESKEIDKPSEPEQQPEYLTGWKLYSVLAAVTLVFFLMLLDIAIVVTVCTLSPR